MPSSCWKSLILLNFAESRPNDDGGCGIKQATCTSSWIQFKCRSLRVFTLGQPVECGPPNQVSLSLCIRVANCATGGGWPCVLRLFANRIVVANDWLMPGVCRVTCEVHSRTEHTVWYACSESELLLAGRRKQPKSGNSVMTFGPSFGVQNCRSSEGPY